MPICERLWFPSEMPYRLELPGHPLSPNRSSGQHWGTIHRDRQLFKDAACVASKPHLHARGGRPLARARITITQIRTARMQPKDPDNLIASCKGAVDGVVAAWLLPDDGPRYVEFAPPVQVIGPRKLTILDLVEIDPHLA